VTSQYRSSDVDLTGRVVVITGASSGIGAATAVLLARAGMRVTLTARRAERLQGVAEQVEAAGGEALVAPADLSDEGALRDVFAQTVERWGRLDALVNNAGLGLPAPFLTDEPEASAAAWHTMWQVNVHALCVATTEALSRFDAETGGHVVHVSSMAGHRVPPGGGFYAATKFAVRGLTEALRKELREAGNPSRISAISPGMVDTEFFQVYSGDEAETAEGLAQHRVLASEDVAAQVLHVLSQPAHVEIHDVLMRPTPQPA
jgi:NADP-dependent 3-hydroxy acid dehydrogenase YdfG